MNKYCRYMYLTKTKPKNLRREIPCMEKLDRKTLQEWRAETRVSILHVSKCFSLDFALGKDKRHLVHMHMTALLCFSLRCSKKSCFSCHFHANKTFYNSVRVKQTTLQSDVLPCVYYCKPYYNLDTLPSLHCFYVRVSFCEFAILQNY